MGNANGREDDHAHHNSGLDTAFEAFVKANQASPMAFHLMVHQCVVAVYTGDQATVSRTLSPEVVGQQFMRDAAEQGGNLILRVQLPGVPLPPPDGSDASRGKKFWRAAAEESSNAEALEKRVKIEGTAGWTSVAAGDTLLHVAARQGHRAVAEYLILCDQSLLSKRNLAGQLPSPQP